MDEQITLNKIKQEGENAGVLPLIPQEMMSIIIGFSLETCYWLSNLSKLVRTSRSLYALLSRHLSPLMKMFEQHREAIYCRNSMNEDVMRDGYNHKAHNLLLLKDVEIDLSMLRMMSALGRRVNFLTLEEKDGKFTAFLKTMGVGQHDAKLPYKFDPVSKETQVSSQYVQRCNGAIVWRNQLIDTDVETFLNTVFGSVWIDPKDSSDREVDRLCSNMASIMLKMRHALLTDFGSYLQALKVWMSTMHVQDATVQNMMDGICKKLVESMFPVWKRDNDGYKENVIKVMQKSTLYNSKELSIRCMEAFEEMFDGLFRIAKSLE